MRQQVSILIISLAAATASTAVAQDHSAVVVVRPVEIHQVLINPGMGITTFQRFNGDPLNSGLG
jgi:hypothetical protein